MWRALEPTRQYSKEIISQLPGSASWSLTMLQERLCLSESPKQSVLRLQGRLPLKPMFTESPLFPCFIDLYRIVADIFLYKTYYLSFAVSPKCIIIMTNFCLVLHINNYASNVPLGSYLETDGVGKHWAHFLSYRFLQYMLSPLKGETSYISKFSWSLIHYVYLYLYHVMLSESIIMGSVSTEIMFSDPIINWGYTEYIVVFCSGSNFSYYFYISHNLYEFLHTYMFPLPDLKGAAGFQPNVLQLLWIPLQGKTPHLRNVRHPTHPPGALQTPCHGHHPPMESFHHQPKHHPMLDHLLPAKAPTILCQTW